MAVLTGKYKTFNDTEGKETLADAINSSAGSGDANKIIKTNSSGLLDDTMLPSGVGREVLTLPATEDLASGNWVNIYDSSGTMSCRKADAATAKPAHGFVLAAVTSGNTATIYLLGQKNTGKSGLTGGTVYFLSSVTPGGEATAPVFTSGYIVQRLGIASGADTVLSEAQVPVTVA